MRVPKRPAQSRRQTLRTALSRGHSHLPAPTAQSAETHSHSYGLTVPPSCVPEGLPWAASLSPREHSRRDTAGRDTVGPLLGVLQPHPPLDGLAPLRSWGYCGSNRGAGPLWGMVRTESPVWLILCVHLSGPWYPDIWADNSLGVSGKVWRRYN